MVNLGRHYAVFGFVTLMLLAFVVGYSIPAFSSGGSDQISSLQYKGYVCVYKNGGLVGCDHNVLYDAGKNMTRDILGGGAVGVPVLNISLCNASTTCGTPVAAATESFTQYSNCGLAPANGAYATLTNAPGNWTITKTFTSTCDNVNTTATRLQNASGGTFGYFAGNSFTLVTLQTNDQLTINWTLMIS